METSDIPCECPEWWFGPEHREKLRSFPENYYGALAHHPDCPKKKFPVDPSFRLPRTIWDRLMEPSR